MTVQTWTLYAAAVVLLCLTPGPNSLLAIANGARYGVARTLLSSLGCAVGLVVLIALSLSGLGIVLSASETVFYVIKLLGAGYLVYLGLALMLSKDGLGAAALEPVTKVPPSARSCSVRASQSSCSTRRY